jgi:uncharacterized alkaline shock family protein YloU
MPIEVKNEFGTVHIAEDVVAVLAGSAALDCYGLVGMASRKQLKDGIAELLGRENLSRGVEVRREGDALHIDLHVIVSYGTKISEVAYNIQTKVKYFLSDIIGLQVDAVNIYVQGVRVTR